MSVSDPHEIAVCRRRALLEVGLALTPLALAPARADDAASEMPPQPGDHLVFLTGPKTGEPVRMEDLRRADRRCRPIQNPPMARARRHAA